MDTTLKHCDSADSSKEISLPSLDFVDGPSFLVDSYDEDSYARRDLSHDPDYLILKEESREVWSIGINKNTLKTMSSMEVKRQDHIWEFIMTERNHCRLLKIMDVILRRGCIDSGLSPLEVNNLFPGVTALTELHMKFLKSLLNLRESRDGSIPDIGSTIISYFSDNDESLIKVYGVMSSTIGSIPFNYRKYCRKNKRFADYVKMVLQNKLLKRKGFSECMLLASQRMMKYPLLINDLIKTTTDTIENSILLESQQIVRNILTSIDLHVERIQNYNTLQNIYDKFDPKSVTQYRNRKFTHATMNHRKHVLKICIPAKCKSAREKWTDINIVVLNKMVIFLNDMKTAFFNQDGKPSVISLSTLLVRPKDGAKTHLYIMSNDVLHPEMFEVQMKSTDLTNKLSACLKDAMKHYTSDSDDDDITSRMYTSNKSIRDMSEMLKSYDERIINTLNRKKNSIQLLQRDITSDKDHAQSHLDMEEILSSVIYECSHLVTLVRKANVRCSGNGVPCGDFKSSSSCSLYSNDSEGQQVKRAETFGGFEGRTKQKSFKKRSSFRETGSKLLSLTKNSKVRRCSTGIFSSLKPVDGSPKDNKRRMSTSALLHQHSNSFSSSNFYIQNDDAYKSSGEISQNSEDITGNSILEEQIESISQICNYLQSLVKLNLDHSSEIESLKVRLSKFEDNSGNLTNMRQYDRKLEELRDMQEKLNSEKEELRLEKENYQNIYEDDLLQQSINKQRLMADKAELKESQDKVAREKAILQTQINLFAQQKTQLQNSRDVSPALPSGGLKIVESDTKRLQDKRESPPARALSSFEKPVQMLPKKLSSSSLSSASMSRHTRPQPSRTNSAPKPGATPLRLPMKLADHSASKTSNSASSSAAPPTNNNSNPKSSQRTEIYF